MMQGLQYLHHDCVPQILHRDIKSNNILLDTDYESHLADFGIAKVVETAVSRDLCSIAGSLGYIAPGRDRATRTAPSLSIAPRQQYLMWLLLLMQSTRSARA